MKNIPHYSAQKWAFLGSILAVLSLLANPVMALRSSAPGDSVRQVLVSNDNFANAMAISALPFRNPVSSFEATQEATDPQTSLCTNAPGLSTVWYKYTPAANVAVHMDTIGSNYDTYMVLYTYNGSSLTEVKCNDDANPTTFESALNWTLTGGLTYYILVGQFNDAPVDAGVGQTKTVPDAGDLGTEVPSHMFRMVLLQRAVFKSVARLDGYVVESNETSGVGRLMNSTLPYVRVGDDIGKRQYRSILSFNTYILPDDAVVTSVVLMVKQGLTSPNVFSKLGYLLIYIRKPYFGNFNGLEAADFSSGGTFAGAFPKGAVGGWLKAIMRSNSLPNVNRTGQTQYRLQFYKDDNNDTVADYIRILSGESTMKPTLFVKFYVP